MDLELQSKSVIVTGGASNIGRAITLGFAAEGACITLADLDQTQANKVAAQALDSGAREVVVQKTDVTDAAQVNAMVQGAKSRFGAIDVLVNNVGWDQLMFFTQTSPEFWEKIIRINFVGVLNCTHTILPIMIEQGGGLDCLDQL